MLLPLHFVEIDDRRKVVSVCAAAFGTRVGCDAVANARKIERLERSRVGERGYVLRLWSMN